MVGSSRDRVDGRQSLRRLVFHPLVVLLASVAAAGLFVFLMIRWPRFAGEGRFYLLYYHAPIGAAFVAYLFDRAEHLRDVRLRQVLVEPAVVALALSRVIVKTPFFSGHALFLGYALLTVSSRVARWLAVLVLVDVVYVKVFVLQDATLWGGLVMGVAAALFVKSGNRRRKEISLCQER